MKKDSHPAYQEVLFVDSATGFKFVCGSTQKSDRFEMFNGKNLPVVALSISSSSHPLYVGGKQIIDAEGRVDRFTRRYQQAAQKKPVVEAEAVAVAAEEPAKTAAAKAAPAKAKAPKKK